MTSGKRMNDERERLMQWQPGMPGFSQDEVVLAVGLQCKHRRFTLADVLHWLGSPDKASGDSIGGHLVYFHKGPYTGEPDDETAFMFDVLNGRIVDFGTIARHRNNAFRQDEVTQFNLLDEMAAFDQKAFVPITQQDDASDSSPATGSEPDDD